MDHHVYVDSSSDEVGRMMEYGTEIIARCMEILDFVLLVSL